MKFFDEHTRDNQNYCYIFRIIAALLVFYTHGQTFLGHGDDILVRLTVKYTEHRQGFGSLGFGIFFVISGFLIAQSFERCKNLKAYTLRRCMRIYPLMILCILITLIIIAPLTTSLSFREYISHQETWNYLYNILLPTIDNTLPGVFKNNPVSTVNGALWTLGIEIILYGFIAITGTLGLLQKRFFWVFLVIFTIVFIVIDIIPGSPPIIMPHGFLPSFGVSKVMLLFMLGTTFYVYRSYIPVSRILCVICSIVFVAGLFIPGSMIISLLAFPYIIIFLAFMPAKRLYGKNDYSYGIYIFHLLVMQLVLLFIPRDISLVLYLILCLFITVLLAYYSWKFIEKPAIQWAKRISEPKYRYKL